MSIASIGKPNKFYAVERKCINLVELNEKKDSTIQPWDCSSYIILFDDDNGNEVLRIWK
jgi:hypothetical protein